MVNAKQKGKRGERELATFLQGIIVSHNLYVNDVFVDPQANGADLISIPGLAMEVKRQENITIGPWWRQAVRQVIHNNRIPVLAYRQNRRPWMFCLPLGQLLDNDDMSQYITLTDRAFEKWFIKFLTGELK